MINTDRIKVPGFGSRYCWRTAPQNLELNHDEVHVWRAELNQPATRVNLFERSLSPDEHERAGRFHFEKDRRRFIIARGLLRAILGQYLNLPPEKLCFSYSDYGKPSLAMGRFGKDLQFNVSHANDVALYAVTRGRSVGIDIEGLRPEFADEEIAENVFSPGEVSTLRRLPASQQTQAFFNCWTRKEAYVKARGEGLSIGLDQFNVSLAPGEPAALLGTKNDPREAARWSIREISPDSSHAAAVVFEGQRAQLKCWRWN